MARTKWIHVYDNDNEGRYVGFFPDQASLDAWLKKGGKGRNIEITDVRPADRKKEES